jgi:hypothetical protein
MKRRLFIKSLPAVSAFSFATLEAAALPHSGKGVSDREYWWQLLDKIVRPVLDNLSKGELRKYMPIETASDAYGDRPEVTHLEALGRTLAGIAPWLALPDTVDEEGIRRKQLKELALQAITNAVDPKSPDYMNWSKGSQPLVDAAFLAHGLLRATNALWEPLDTQTKDRLLQEFDRQKLAIKPFYNNWLLFGAMLEAFRIGIGEKGDLMRMDYAIKKHQEWYLGDGWYGDGPEFHLDFYNAFVIHPMLVQVLEMAARVQGSYTSELETAIRRMQRYSVQQEMLISPEGTFPGFGRSLTYRSAAFQPLGEVILRDMLPDQLQPGQVRAALTKVYSNIFESPGVFDENGWLQLGFAGHQPGLAEPYISTGSLYLCTVGFLPLGLAANHPFWNSDAMPWSSQKLWTGQQVHRDQAMGK